MKKLIISFPGLSLKEEGGRLEEIASHFPDFDFKKINYPGIEKIGDVIYIPFSIEKFSKEAEIPKGYDQVGILASSTGVPIFAHYLKKNPLEQIDWHIAISPFCKVNPQAIPKIQYLKENQKDLDISNEYDQKNGRKRVIPNSYIQNILNLDTNFQEFSRKIPHVLTMLGSQDSIIDFQKAREYHFNLGGKQKNLRIFNAGHPLNEESTTEAINFIKELIKP